MSIGASAYRILWERQGPVCGASLIAEPFLDPAPEHADRSTLRSSVSWQGQVGVVALPSSGDFPRRA